VISVVALDLISKYTVHNAIDYGADIPLINGLLSFTHSHNKGAAFGMLSDLPAEIHLPFFSVVATVASIIIGILIYKTDLKKKLEIFSLALVLGGALGNLINRFWLGYVVDFISFHWNYTYTFPTFNVADIAICLGIGLILIISFNAPPRTTVL
jgi:signal peptidase II